MKTNNSTSKNLIAVLMMLTIVAMLFTALPNTNAQTSAPIIVRDSHLYINVAPNPCGIGQSAQILCWANIYPAEYAPNIAGQTGPAMYARFHNFTFTITKPDGTTETKLFPETDPLGSAYFNYIPTTVGTYYVQCSYPGETYSNNASFSAQISKKVSFVVQTDQIPLWPDNPLPTGYWARPIDATNRNWYSIGGNWLDFSQGQNYGYNYWTNFAPYTTAPNSAHIAWVKVHANGGLVGGENFVDEYYTGESYSMKFMPIVLDGRLYYNLRVGQGTARGFTCVDIRTGEELYRNNDTTLTGAFAYNLESPNQHGTIPYLVQISGTTMNFFDPLNGQKVFAIVNCTTGAVIMNNTAGPGYTNDMNTYTLSNNQLICWSFQKCVGVTGASGNISWANGIQYNVSIPKPVNSGGYAIGTGGGLVDGKIVVARSANTTIWPPVLYLVGIRCTDGQILWTSNTTLLENPAAGGWRGGGGVALDSSDGVYLNYKQETMQVLGWDLTTGAVKYTTTARTDDWGMFTSGWSIDTAYGKFYVGAYDGWLYAYDAKTGAFLWKYSSGNSGLETPYGSWPFFLGIPYGMTIADGKVFAATGEHSPNDPYYRGEQLHVIDVNTGLKVWSLQGWWCGNAIADGYYVGFNGYDGRIYSIGKGLSATTIQTPTIAVAAGSTIPITGTVTDQSPGQTGLGIPAAGTPAISDDSMTQWMEYLYMQQPQPANATGVPVQLVAIDSSGASTNIGTVTSGITGFFNTHWTVPTTPGDYQIIANFPGTNSYYTSSAVGAITVVAPEPTSTPLTANDVAQAVVSALPVQTAVPTAPSASDVANQVVAQLPAEDNTLLYAAIAIIIIAVLIGIVNLAVLMMRRKQAA
jgi:hypothetical protein